ncbi:MAG: PD-(D/E)XK nuclease family protein [Ignavibacteria bacterium]|nr:PD-(D/E)XK nuclease family protein [Ignavibacteria bacterium]
MKAFLEKLADEILTVYPDPSEVTVIFPSRRAGIFFRKYFSEKIKHPVFSPEIYSISDFIEKLSPLRFAGELELIIELYHVFGNFNQAEVEEFDRFYPWGKMMLSDFDEVDKQLSDAKKLFRAVKAEKKLEEEFQLEFESTPDSFWKMFTTMNPSDLKEDFLKTWEILGSVYENFRNTLLEKNSGYEGMCYRKVYEMIQTGQLKPRNVVFAGFNFLNKCEEGIIRKLLIEGEARIYWDADEYYLKNEKHEAGRFIRENFRKFRINEPLWLEKKLAEDKKNIKITAAPLIAGQAKAAGEIIRGIKESELGNTALVLPDESLLIPVLSSLPDSVKELNVTMGYPLNESPLYRLMQLVGRLHRNKKQNGYYYKDVCEILLHPYIRFVNTSENFRAVNRINKNNIIYINRERILNFYNTPSSLIIGIFSDPDEIGVYKYLKEILLNIESVRESDALNRFDREFVFRVYSLLDEFHRSVEKYQLKLKSHVFIRFFNDSLNSERIPFVGEPLKGLQVMGLLETRTLDFENVIILSMNEGTMPKLTRKSSYIPYNIRKSFGLQTYEDDDAIASYLFYRLIQRAKNIYLIYKTEEEGLAPGEKSRFIMQLEYELAEVNRNVNIKNERYVPDLSLRNKREISITKDREVIDSLKDILYFSPSALSTYISCSLKFYFERVLRLKKEESAEEVLSGAGFGNILHYIMQELYRAYEGQEVTQSVIEILKKEFERDYERYWLEACDHIEELKEFSRELSGRNLLLKHVMRKIVLNILENDKLQAPFRILNLELELEKNLNISDKLSLKLKGVIDRVEEKGGYVRIIDYKTGKIKFSADDFKELSFEKIFSNPKLKEIFQLFCYAYLYIENNQGSDIIIGLYHIRESSRGIELIKPDPENHTGLDEFEVNLKKLLGEMFNPDIKFSQTTENIRCKWCDFKSICYREDT